MEKNDSQIATPEIRFDKSLWLSSNINMTKSESLSQTDEMEAWKAVPVHLKDQKVAMFYRKSSRKRLNKSDSIFLVVTLMLMDNLSFPCSNRLHRCV